ncbi:MAG: hypothetical protein GWN82_08580 [Gemmatimonadetes bacterium]|nr:hypothetical protein [Gemmatimonadota bacterium]NIU30759.1 hypothetical protein [Gemmatimonadota bacterium]
MDPLIASLILFAGLILVAASMTALVVTESPGSRALRETRSRPRPVAAADEVEPARPRVTAVPISIFCPDRVAPASVRLGVTPREQSPALTVLQCEYFEDGPVTCDMSCLSATVAA